ncbi:alpha-enolase-like [Notothenia coriiceps]|uniref:phosphopyruvate hydratase n=1 Tax=Notothenia coriiceps TaxID=8208 RepID=A0A6I9N3T1_9TELE|nr:PREDICTED: alpha-enolase-like [Notothenia coriiceps]
MAKVSDMLSLSQGINVLEQEKLDNMMIEMDGTENKSKFGANAILGVSLALCKAGAAEKGVPLYRHIADLAGNEELVLPVPAFNVINGGSHAGNRLAMQEFMVLPVGAESFRDALRMGAELYQTLRDVIKEKYGQDATNVGDEGGFAPNIQENREALELIKTAIEKAGFTDKVVIGMDVAASEFFSEGKYDLDFKSPPNAARNISGEELASIYQGFIKDYPVVSIEDPFDQDDWPAWSDFTASVGIQPSPLHHYITSSLLALTPSSLYPFIPPSPHPFIPYTPHPFIPPTPHPFITKSLHPS